MAIPAGIGAAGAIISTIINNMQNKKTPIQGQQKELIDKIMGSLDGNGPYSDLFNVDENSFQKSFVDPMKQQFQSQIAPQIQQSYISSGQQRGTGLDDTLARAGVNMDQLLNQHYAQMQQGAMNRKAGAMNSILGQNAGPQEQMSSGEAALQGAGGLMGTEEFNRDIGELIKAFTDRNKNSLKDTIKPLRKGFEGQNQVYNPYTGIQEQS